MGTPVPEKGGERQYQRQQWWGITRFSTPMQCNTASLDFYHCVKTSKVNDNPIPSHSTGTQQIKQTNKYCVDFTKL